MFADSVIQRKLDGFEEQEGWRPVEHSIEEVDWWQEKLETAFTTDSKGNIYQARSLTEKEKQFISNERAMCVASCGYFMTRYYWIKAKNNILRFTFRQGQWILWEMLRYLDDKGFSKQLQILKARQLGISTVCEGIVLWGALFCPGVAAQIGSSDAQKSQAMLGMLLFAKDQISSLYPWLPPDETRSKRSSDRPIIGFEKIGTRIIVQHGSMRGGMAQGDTPTLTHLSELSQYTDPVKQIDEAILKCLHPGPELVVLLESTGDASHRSAWWWKRKWEWNRDHYWSGGARMLPVFIPWHTTPELYPGPTFILEHPVPPDFTPNEATKEHVNRCEAYVKCTPMLSKIIGENWRMPIEQQWYWQFNYEEAKGQRVEKSWIRQMPGDDFEALMGERDKIVGNQAIEVMSKSIAKIEDYQSYQLTGDGIPEKYEPKTEDVWYGDDSPPRIKFHWNNMVEKRFEWMLVPLKKDLDDTFDPLGKIILFEEPRENFDYSIGWDTGTGVGGDRSIITVTRYGTDDEPDVQVAEYASDTVSLDDIYIFGCAISALYARYMERSMRHPKMVIEQRRKYGDRPYSLARFGMGFTRWHEWGQGFDRKTKKDKVGKNGRIGWYTNEWSRPMLLSSFFGAVENGWYVVRSPWLMEEISGMEQRTTDSGKTRADHERGEHDDRVFAAAMSYFTFHKHDLMAERMQKRYESPSESSIVVESGQCTQSIVIPGETWWKYQQAKEDRLYPLRRSGL